MQGTEASYWGGLPEINQQKIPEGLFIPVLQTKNLWMSENVSLHYGCAIVYIWKGSSVSQGKDAKSSG